MISLEHLVSSGYDFGVHCPSKADVELLVGYIYEKYPEKHNRHKSLIEAWDDYREDTIIYPNILNCNQTNYGRLGGPASLRRKIYRMCDLEVPEDLPIESSDMDLDSMLGL